MEPLTAGVIITLIATKAFEKTGEKLSESVWNQVDKFLTSLKRKDPQTAAAIEQVAQQPALAEQQPAQFGTAALSERVEAAIQSDPELQQIAEAVKAKINVKPSIVQNFTKMAEEIKAEKGSMVAQQITIEHQVNNYN